MTFRTLILALSCFGLAFTASAQVMESASYRIQSDSVNVGGAYSSSSSYRLEDTTGEIATGVSSSTLYTIGAGYQQMQETYLALTSAADVVLSPSLGGITGGTSNGSTAVTATTDGAAGYSLTIEASSSPAMQSGEGDTIADYAPAGADPDFAFAIPTGSAAFGFTPEGDDISSRFKDNGSACNTGSGDTTLSCWDGLDTTPVEFARRTSANHPSGTETTLRFRVGMDSAAMQPPGTYTATTTITLLSL